MKIRPRNPTTRKDTLERVQAAASYGCNCTRRASAWCVFFLPISAAETHSIEFNSISMASVRSAVLFLTLCSCSESFLPGHVKHAARVTTRTAPSLSAWQTFEAAQFRFAETRRSETSRNPGPTNQPQPAPSASASASRAIDSQPSLETLFVFRVVAAAT